MAREIVGTVPIAWSDRLGGGWEAWCDECGSLWSETSHDVEELDLMQQRAERAALLHEDNGHAPIVYRDGEPAVDAEWSTRR